MGKQQNSQARSNILSPDVAYLTKFLIYGGTKYENQVNKKRSLTSVNSSLQRDLKANWCDIKMIMLTKIMNMNIWVVGTSNQLFRRSSYTDTKFSKK